MSDENRETNDSQQRAQPPTGRNFAAGMSGGIGYVFDPDHNLPINCNQASVELENVDGSDEVAELRHEAADGDVLGLGAVAQTRVGAAPGGTVITRDPQPAERWRQDQPGEVIGRERGGHGEFG